MFGLFGKKKSAKTAKDRIQLVVINDRANCSPEVLNMMKQDIIEVIKKYMVIDETGLDINIETESHDKPALFVNIPIKKMRK